jgi:excisionase family DNA binding protein
MEYVVPEKENIESLEALYEALTIRGLPELPRLVANDGIPMELSPQVAQVLKLIVSELHSGRSLTIVAHDAKLTSQQAANHLGVSRPTLITLLSRYSVPVETTGRHRRIAFGDLKKLEAKLKADQVKVLREMTELSRSSGLLDTNDFSNPLIK